MGRRDFFEEKKLKRIIYVFTITLIISIIAFLTIFIMYNKKLKEESSSQILELGKLNDIVSNEELEDLEETSMSSDKSVSDAKSTTNTTSSTSEVSVEKPKKENVVSNIPVTSVVENVVNEVVENIVSESNTNEVVEQAKELSFAAPVSGEILKDFAIDTLIYSNTLEEWTTHSGIDIQAEKTTVVVASETGIVESIKTDPRYGLTVTISHNDEFKTVYSNLLTTEFVSEGQTVEKGQTIATIGESSSFEIAEEPHLHFEILKNGECVNPTIYLKEI